MVCTVYFDNEGFVCLVTRYIYQCQLYWLLIVTHLYHSYTKSQDNELENRLFFFCFFRMCLYGAYNYSGLVRQASGFSNVSVSVRWVHVVLSTLLDLRAEESRVVRQVKPPRCGEASGRPRALSRDRIQAIGALAHRFKR